MKFCKNCGTQLKDAAKFCGKCGTKQEVIGLKPPQKEDKTHYDIQTTPQASKNTRRASVATAKTAKKKISIKRIVPLVIILVVIGLIASIFLGGRSAEGVAIDFAEALLDDADAKKAVSLMSEDLIESSLANTGCATEKVLVAYLSDGLEAERKTYKKIEIEYIDQQKYGDFVEVYLSCTYTREMAFSLSDEEVTDTITIELIKERSQWRVNAF